MILAYRSNMILLISNQVTFFLVSFIHEKKNVNVSFDENQISNSWILSEKMATTVSFVTLKS